MYKSIFYYKFFTIFQINFNVIFLKIVIYPIWNFQQIVSISVTLHQLFIDSREMRLIECIRTRIDLFQTFQNILFKEVILRWCEQEAKLGQFIYIVNITLVLTFPSFRRMHCALLLIVIVSVDPPKFIWQSCTTAKEVNDFL